MNNPLAADVSKLCTALKGTGVKCVNSMSHRLLAGDLCYPCLADSYVAMSIREETIVSHRICLGRDCKQGKNR